MSAAALPAPSLTQRLGLILEGLRRLIALRAGRNHALIPWVVVLWGRLGRTLTRVAAIAARHQAGTLRRPPKPRAGRAASTPAPRPPPPRDPLPRQPGWLVRRIQESVVYGNYLSLWLDEPETRALIEAAPQLRRHLRPLWRMLRTDAVPEILRPPAAAASASASPGARAISGKTPPPRPVSGARATRRTRRAAKPSITRRPRSRPPPPRGA